MKLREKVPNNTAWIRAAGESVCPVCGKAFAAHAVVEVEGTDPNGPLLLRRLCSGRFVKL